MPEEAHQSSNFKRFRLAVTAAALLLLGSFIMYQLGRDEPALVTLSGLVSTGATALFVVAVVMRWRGPWRDEESGH